MRATAGARVRKAGVRGAGAACGRDTGRRRVLSTDTVGSGGWLVADAGGAVAGVSGLAAPAGAAGAPVDGGVVLGAASVLVRAGSAGCADR